MRPHRAASWYAEAGITLHLADPALAIDRAARVLRLRSGTLLPYGRLVPATGARARGLPQLPPRLDNVLTLRSAEDAGRLRTRLAAAQRVTVLGGGEPHRVSRRPVGLSQAGVA